MPKKSKVDLMVEINNLKNDLQCKDNELYDAGIKVRPTMIGKIETREETALKTINYIIEECEKETGRKLALVPNFIDPNHLELMLDKEI